MQVIQTKLIQPKYYPPLQKEEEEEYDHQEYQGAPQEKKKRIILVSDIDQMKKANYPEDVLKYFAANNTPYGFLTNIDYEINNWLHDQGADFKLIDIKFSTIATQDSIEREALIIYDE